MSEVSISLKQWLTDAKKIAVIGIGNKLRRDDFVGLKIVRDLKGKLPEHVMLIECETTPESFIELITRFDPSHILILDAGFFKSEASGIQFLRTPEELDPLTSTISTHYLPLRIFCEYLEKTLDVKIAFLVVQVKRTDFGEGLTKEVETTSERVKKMLQQLLPANTKQ
ncbi:MAG: hydrogenase maturation protease [Candidatus Bathyarchaeota archaeon]|nr:MAG: hydrogenase maturation protease [Candidatus Bathyarchaeota archaeon]